MNFFAQQHRLRRHAVLGTPLPPILDSSPEETTR
jgi:hypothetical protein